jgi:hypothetical protein
MIYFMVVGAIAALIGLSAIAAATEAGLLVFGFGLFVFGVLFALFLVKRHFDQADADAHS